MLANRADLSADQLERTRTLMELAVPDVLELRDVLWVGYFGNGADYMRPDGSIEHHRELAGVVSGILPISPTEVQVMNEKSSV